MICECFAVKTAENKAYAWVSPEDSLFVSECELDFDTELVKLEDIASETDPANELDIELTIEK